MQVVCICLVISIDLIWLFKQFNYEVQGHLIQQPDQVSQKKKNPYLPWCSLSVT